MAASLVETLMRVCWLYPRDTTSLTSRPQSRI
jgi:hypothetical protein